MTVCNECNSDVLNLSCDLRHQLHHFTRIHKSSPVASWDSTRPLDTHFRTSLGTFCPLFYEYYKFRHTAWFTYCFAPNIYYGSRHIQPQSKYYFMFLSKGKDLLIFNVQVCLTCNIIWLPF